MKVDKAWFMAPIVTYFLAVECRWWVWLGTVIIFMRSFSKNVSMSNSGGHISNSGGHISNSGGHMSNYGGDISNSGGHISNSAGHISNSGGHMSNYGGDISNSGSHISPRKEAYADLSAVDTLNILTVCNAAAGYQ